MKKKNAIALIAVGLLFLTGAASVTGVSNFNIRGGTHNKVLHGSVAAPSLTSATGSGSGGTLAANTYFYVVTALDSPGESIASNERTVTTTGSTSSVALVWVAVAGVSGYRVYRGTSAGVENVFYAPGNVTTYTDTGSAGTAGSPPAVAYGFWAPVNMTNDLTGTTLNATTINGPSATNPLTLAVSGTSPGVRVQSADPNSAVYVKTGPGGTGSVEFRITQNSSPGISDDKITTGFSGAVNSNADDTEIYTTDDLYLSPNSDNIVLGQNGSGNIQIYSNVGDDLTFATATNTNRLNLGTYKVSLGTSFSNDVTVAKVTTYNGHTTAGQGLSAVQGSYMSNVDETGAIGSGAIFTTGAAGAGLYSVRIYANSAATCATPGAANIQTQIGWTDPSSHGVGSFSVPLQVNGATTLSSSMALGNTTNWASGSLSVAIGNSQAFNFGVAFTACTSGTAKYRVYIAVTREI